MHVQTVAIHQDVVNMTDTIGTIQTEEVRMRNKASELYAQLTLNAGLELPEQFTERFHDMWYSKVDEPITILPAPPGGWEKFNQELGGIPWHGAYDHTVHYDIAPRK